MIPTSTVRTAVLATVIVVLGLTAAATVPMSVEAVPDTHCVGSGGGAMFVADSGFTVEYNDTQPMPDNGPFRGDDTMRFRNVTLSSSGDAFLRLENGTGPETCLAAVDATAVTVQVDPDGEQPVVIEGEVDALSLADADYGGGSVDLAYEASSPWILTLPSTGLDEGTKIEAVGGSGTELATGIVDSGELILELPTGNLEVDLREVKRTMAQISITSATTQTSEVAVNETVAVTVELRNNDDASADYTATLAVDGQVVADETVTVGANATATVRMTTSFAQPGTYSLAVNGQDAGEVTVSDGQSSEDPDGDRGEQDSVDDGSEQDSVDDGSEQDSVDGSGPPWPILLAIVVLLAGVGGYALVRRAKSDSA